MAEPLLLVPGYGVSPAACEDVPPIAALLARLRELYEVAVFHWPTVRDGPKVEPTWQGVAGTFEDALPTGGHLLGLSGNVTYAFPVLKKRGDQLRSMVAFGFDLPVATLKAAGLHSLAAAGEAVAAMDADFRQGTLPWYEGASEEEAVLRAMAILRDADQRRAQEFAQQAQNLNLFELAPSIQTPTLFVESPLPFPGFADCRELFKQFVPNSEFAWLPSWRQHMAEDGEKLAGLVVPFLQRHGARG